MEQWVSYSNGRRSKWHGHKSVEGVRKSIRYANTYNHDLHIFSLGTLTGYQEPVFLEIHPSNWDVVFPA